MVAGDGGVEGKDEGKRIVREFGMDMYTLLCLKWVTKVLVCSTGNSVHVMWQPG